LFGLQWGMHSSFDGMMKTGKITWLYGVDCLALAVLCYS